MFPFLCLNISWHHVSMLELAQNAKGNANTQTGQYRASSGLDSLRFAAVTQRSWSGGASVDQDTSQHVFSTWEESGPRPHGNLSAPVCHLYMTAKVQKSGASEKTPVDKPDDICLIRQHWGEVQSDEGIFQVRVSSLVIISSHRLHQQTPDRHMELVFLFMSQTSPVLSYKPCERSGTADGSKYYNTHEP